MSKLISQNIVTKLISRPNFSRLVSVAKQGPPGPTGPGVGVKQASFSDPAPLEGEHVLLAYALYAMTIDGLFGLKTSVGDIVLTITVNGAPVTGLDSILVNGTPQNPSATALNAVAEGDEVAMVLSDKNSAEDLQFTLKATA